MDIRGTQAVVAWHVATAFFSPCDSLGVDAFTIRNLTLVGAQLFTGFSANAYVVSYLSFRKSERHLSLIPRFSEVVAEDSAQAAVSAVSRLVLPQVTA